MFDHSTIAEDEEVDNSTASQNDRMAASESEKKYTWRVDLSRSEQYWSGWFENLSAKFLDLHVPKLLLLASIDGLDRALTVGQMQGKFQLQVLARCGHAVHEVYFFIRKPNVSVFRFIKCLNVFFLQDRPHEVAEVIANYMIRNKFVEAIGDFTSYSPCC